MSKRMLEAAEHYAAYDKSDPFALARAKTHIANGIATHYNAEGKEAFYSAEPFQETRSFTDGQGRLVEYPITVYRNLSRP